LKPVIEGFDFLDETDQRKVFEENARRVFPRLQV
jgi:4-oxalmesaconate hydratase